MNYKNAIYNGREYVVRFSISANGELSTMVLRPLVRCKDCVHRVSCNRNITPVGRRDNDFCSCGDRW